MNDHPRTTALVEKAKEIIQNHLRRVKDQRKRLVTGHAAHNEELVRLDSEHRSHQVALDHLSNCTS